MVLGSDAKVGQEGVLMQQNSVAKALHLSQFPGLKVAANGEEVEQYAEYINRYG